MTIGYATLGLAGTYDDSDARVERCVAEGTVYPGRLVYRANVSGYGSDARSRAVKLPATADMTALARTFTPSSFTAGQIITSINFRGISWSVSSTFDTDLSTTLAAHVVDINESLDDRFTAASSIVATSSATVLTLTAEVAGEWFTATCVAGNGTMAVGGGTGTNLLSLLVGMVGEEGSVLDSSSVANFADEKACPVVSYGKVNITRDTTGAITPATQFYLDTTSAKEGMVTSTSDAYAIWLPMNAVSPVEAPATGTYLTVGNVAEVWLNINALRAYVGA